MNTVKTIGISFVVALVVATGFYFITPRNTPTDVGAIAGPSVLTPVEFQDGLFVTGSSTLGIGTTSGNQPLQSRQGLVIDALNATPTIATFATSTLINGSTNSYGGCIQLNSATGTAFRIYVGDGASTVGLSSDNAGSNGLIFEQGSCQ